MSAMSKPLVSIIVATYERDKELAKALKSIGEQTYRPLEVIVVDDNNDSERSKAVENCVHQFAKSYPNISLKNIRNESNLGSALTRNVGINVSSGEYICFLDDDDEYLPERVKNQVDAMIAQDADYSLTDLKLYSEDEKLIETRHHSYISDGRNDSLLQLHLMHHLTGTDTMMFKHEYLLQIGCFSPIDVGDEFYLMQKAIINGGKFLYLPICDVKAYVHTGEGGLSSGRGKILGENALFEHKKKYFPQLDKKTVRYIKMRHYSVLAYAYLRQKKLIRFAFNGVKSFLSSPIECVKLFVGR